MILNIDGTDTTIDVNDSSYRYRKIMGENSLTLTFALPYYIDIPIGASCQYQGETYSLTKPGNFKKISTRNYEYTLILDSAQSQLDKYVFRNPVSSELKFSLTARPQEHLQMLIDNLNMRDSGWAMGDYIDAVEKTISYNFNTCIDALGMMATAFSTEWEVSGKTIHLRRVEYNKSDPLALSYGRGNGFKSGIVRNNTDNTLAFEILFTEGGSRNIDPSKYGSSVLLLPKSQSYTYERRVYQTDAAGLSIRRGDKSLTTGQEACLDLTNIYPSRMGYIYRVYTVDAINNFYDFDDVGIPSGLDYTACLIGGDTMTVIFQSGMLAGREFEVSYDHLTQKFAIVPQTLDGVKMPGGVYVPASGDQYAVFGIQLPDAYICDNSTQSGGSWDMFMQGVKYMYENEDPNFTFTGELDGIWAKTNWMLIGGKILLGGYISFTDVQFQTSPVLIRITGIKDFINKPYKPTIELSNVTVGGSLHGVITKLETTEVVVSDAHKDSIQFTKRRFRDAQETMDMLTASLLHFSGAINPIAIQTMQLLVGDPRLQFRFTNGSWPQTVTNPVFTYNKTTKVFHYNGGYIQHMTLGVKYISSVVGIYDRSVWTLANLDSPALTNTAAYYVYIKAAKGTFPINGTGSIVMSLTAIALEAVTGYYHFLVGILNSEYEGDRSWVTLYGFTEILPGRITTDKVISADGLNYFDFVANAFHIGNSTASLDFNSSGDGKLRLKGTLLQSGSGVETPIGAFRGAWSNTTVYYPGDECTYLGSSYRYILTYATSGLAITNTSYFIVVASAGVDGAYWEYQYAKNGSTTAAPSLTNTQVNPTGWSTTMPTLSALEYLWMITTKKTAAGVLVQNWSAPVRTTPADGATGDFYETRYQKNTSPTTAPSITVTDLVPSGWALSAPKLLTTDYLWQTTSRKNGAGTALTANWSAPVRSSIGQIGPSPIYQGVYEPLKTYHGKTSQVDIVQYTTGGTTQYYVASVDAGDFSGQTPGATGSIYWNVFAAQFESVATKLLFASLAYVENLGVKYLQTDTSGQRVFIDGSDGSLKFYNSSNAEVMSLKAGVMTAIGAVLNDAVFNTVNTSDTTRIEIQNGILKLWDDIYTLARITLNRDGISLGFGANLELGGFGNINLYSSNSVQLYNSGLDLNTSYLKDKEVGSWGFQFLRLQSVDEQTAWCAAHPLSLFVNATGHLCFVDGNNAPHTIY